MSVAFCCHNHVLSQQSLQLQSSISSCRLSKQMRTLFALFLAVVLVSAQLNSTFVLVTDYSGNCSVYRLDFTKQQIGSKVVDFSYQGRPVANPFSAFTTHTIIFSIGTILFQINTTDATLAATYARNKNPMPICWPWLPTMIKYCCTC